MTLKLRAYGPEHENAAFSAWAEAVTDGGSFPRKPPAHRADFRQVWVDEAKKTTVCFRGGEFAGVYFVAPNFTGPCSHIAKAGYVVTKSHRRRGVGRALVTDSIRSAKQLGFDAMMFNLVMERNPSRRLYTDLGFVEIGRIPNAIGEQAAFIYWRSI